jgi:hypothetical protein
MTGSTATQSRISLSSIQSALRDAGAALLDTELLHAGGPVRLEWKHEAVKRLGMYLGTDDTLFMCRPWMEPPDE